MEVFIKSVGILFTIFLVHNPASQYYAGSVVLFNYKNENYIVTCRHCIDKYDYPGFSLKVNSNSSTNPMNKNLNIITEKGDYNFHPKDTDLISYDIAVAKMENDQNNFFNYSITQIKLPSLEIIPKLDIKDSLIVIGYPQTTFDKTILESDTCSLKPNVIRGEFVYTTPANNVKAEGMDFLLQDQFYVKISESDHFNGMSGGLVLLKRDKNYYPIGIVTSTTTGKYQNEYINAIGFTHISEVYKSIDAL